MCQIISKDAWTIIIEDRRENILELKSEYLVLG